jgi:hypothetical protein
MKSEIEVIENFNINGAIFEVVKMPMTIYAGVIGWADESGMELPVDIVKEKMYRDIDKIIVGKTSPECEVSINIYVGNQTKMVKKGVLIAREVNTTAQPEGVYVHVRPKKTYIRCKCTPESAKLLGQENCSPYELSDYILNIFMPEHEFRLGYEYSYKLKIFWREMEYIEYDSACVCSYVPFEGKKINAKNRRAWHNRRYCGLLVDFPSNLTPDILKNDDVCSQYDPEEAYDALKSAHVFLTGIANEFLENTEETDEKVYKKFRLLWWFLERAGELKEEYNIYCLYFQKQNLYVIAATGKKWGAEKIPKNYPQGFQLLSENGCYVEYYKNGNPDVSFKVCDSGALFFDDRLTALGLKLFYSKLIQKRWYQKYDIGNRYSTYTGLRPEACKEVFNRVDMRIFNCGDRLEYDIEELLVGYSDELKKCFKKIYNFVEENYPDCMPYIPVGVNCSATFCVDEKHRMIGQINFGGCEKHFDAYIAMTGKEFDTLLADIDSFSGKVTMQFLHEASCECEACKTELGQVYYRGELYNMIYGATENRFFIENEGDADDAIKCMKIKAECNMNTRTV